MKPLLYLLNPSIVFKARVNMPSGIDTVNTHIIYDTITAGSESAIKQGMTLLLGSADGLDDYGRQRVAERYSGDLTANEIYIGATPKGVRDGELYLVDNAHITVLNDYRIWSVIPSDGAYTDIGRVGIGTAQLPQPKANGGCGWAGTANPTTELATVKFSGQGSIAWSGAVTFYFAGPSTYLWNVVDGTIIVGTSSSMDITATFPPGFRWVSLTVSDGSMGTTVYHTHYLPVFVRDPDGDNTITDFTITSHSESKAGTDISILLLEDVPRTLYPDGTLAMLWDEDEPADDETERAHMFFIGWVQSEGGSIVPQRTGTLKDTVLNLTTVAGRMKTLPAFSQVMEYKETVETPDAWYYTEYPSALHYVWHLLNWPSTVLSLAQLNWGNGQTLAGTEFKVLSSGEGNLYDLANSIANHVTPDCHITCDRLGRLHIVTDKMLQHVSDRSVDIALTLSDDDWTSIRYEQVRPPRVMQMISYAVMGGKDDYIPIASIAPADGRGQGIGTLETSERLAYGQSYLNYTEGNRYARLNSTMPSISITCPHFRMVNWEFSPAYMEWVNLVVAKHESHRGDFPQTIRGLIQEMTIQWNYAETGITRDATLTFEPETSGPPAATLPLDIYVLTIVIVGNGTVTKWPSQISYADGDSVLLNAVPAGGHYFSEWTGACSGSSVCTLIMDSSKTVTATFIEV